MYNIFFKVFNKLQIMKYVLARLWVKTEAIAMSSTTQYNVNYVTMVIYCIKAQNLIYKIYTIQT